MSARTPCPAFEDTSRYPETAVLNLQPTAPSEIPPGLTESFEDDSVEISYGAPTTPNWSFEPSALRSYTRGKTTSIDVPSKVKPIGESKSANKSNSTCAAASSEKQQSTSPSTAVLPQASSSRVVATLPEPPLVPGINWSNGIKWTRTNSDVSSSPRPAKVDSPAVPSPMLSTGSDIPQVLLVDANGVVGGQPDGDCWKDEEQPVDTKSTAVEVPSIASELKGPHLLELKQKCQRWFSSTEASTPVIPPVPTMWTGPPINSVKSNSPSAPVTQAESSLLKSTFEVERRLASSDLGQPLASRLKELKSLRSPGKKCRVVFPVVQAPALIIPPVPVHWAMLPAAPVLVNEAVPETLTIAEEPQPVHEMETPVPPAPASPPAPDPVDDAETFESGTNDWALDQFNLDYSGASESSKDSTPGSPTVDGGGFQPSLQLLGLLHAIPAVCLRPRGS
jgi:hypothetical protein